MSVYYEKENQNDKVGKMHYFIPEKFQLKKETGEQKEYEIKENSGKQAVFPSEN